MGFDRVTARWFALGVVAMGCHRAPEPPPDCHDGPTTPGLDVSYYQETIDWPKVRRAGLRFAFIRVSDGTTIDDPMFDKNWAGAKRAGLLRGAYQHFRPEESAREQADMMIAALMHDGGELPPVIDVEVDGGKRPDEIAANVRAWIERVRDKLHVEPIVYTGPEFWRDRVGGADVGVPLWVAHYTRECPAVPAPWARWTYWQHTDSGRVPGIYGPVDLDVFAGTVDDLRSLRTASRE